MDDDQETELRNPFPSPPSHYQQYTTHNLQLLTLLQERTSGDGEPNQDQHEVLADQKDVPEWPLKQLEKPRVDWILEEGFYNVYGEVWPVKETVSSLAEQGGQQLYPEDPTVDRRPALLSILRSLLVSYSRLLKAILLPPPSLRSAEPPEWVEHINWMSTMSQNLMAAANDLRPVQARFNLEAMMKRQLDLRREETASIHRKCDDLQRRLLELKDVAYNVAKEGDEVKDDKTPSNIGSETMEDVLRWAEGL